jgi:hypothetical protein
MKFKLLIGFCFCSAVLFSQKKNIKITFTFIQPYCGGARPTEEMQRDAEKEKAYAGKTIVYVSAKGKIDSCRTDENGTVKLRLRKGSYTLYESWRYNLYTPHNLPIESFDRACLVKEWQKPLCTVKVQKKDVKITGLNAIINTCPWRSPCLLDSAQPPLPE